MKYKLTKSRKEPCWCSSKYCKVFISKVGYAYTSSPKPLCGSCGHLENQYADVGMERPVK